MKNPVSEQTENRRFTQIQAFRSGYLKPERGMSGKPDLRSNNRGKLPKNRDMDNYMKGKKHTNKTSFKPGISGNPGGRKKLSPEIREMKGRAKEDLIIAYSFLSEMNPQRFLKYKPKTIIEAGMKTAIAEFAKTGKALEISKVWEYVLGKPQIEQAEPVPVKIVFGAEEADL